MDNQSIEKIFGGGITILIQCRSERGNLLILQKAPKLNFQDFFYILICKLKIKN